MLPHCLPWATIVILIAVASSLSSASPMLWCAEALTLRANDRAQAMAVRRRLINRLRHGSMFVMSSMMNTLNQPLNGVVLSNSDMMA